MTRQDQDAKNLRKARKLYRSREKEDKFRRLELAARRRGHMMFYYTISNRDSGKPLGMGGPLDLQKAVSILTLRKLVLSEWCVTKWYGDGSDNDLIEWQTGGDEFLRDYHRIHNR